MNFKRYEVSSLASNGTHMSRSRSYCLHINQNLSALPVTASIILSAGRMSPKSCKALVADYITWSVKHLDNQRGACSVGDMQDGQKVERCTVVIVDDHCVAAAIAIACKKELNC